MQKEGSFGQGGQSEAMREQLKKSRKLQEKLIELKRFEAGWGELSKAVKLQAKFASILEYVADINDKMEKAVASNRSLPSVEELDSGIEAEISDLLKMMEEWEGVEKGGYFFAKYENQPDYSMNGRLYPVRVPPSESDKGKKEFSNQAELDKFRTEKQAKIVEKIEELFRRLGPAIITRE